VIPLTRLGAAVLATGLLSLGLGWWLTWQEFIQLGLVSIVLVVLAVLFALLPGQPTARLVVEPRRVQVGWPTPIAFLQVQAGALPLLGSRIEIPYGAAPVVVYLGFVRPYARKEIQVDLPRRPRGVYQVGHRRAEHGPRGRGEPSALDERPGLPRTARVRPR
jgi:hypothetical protein